jgi:hypothetical protein
MIDLRDVWLPQIIAYAEFIEEDGAVRAAWIDGDRSQTSVTDFDELMEQVFGDADAKEQLKLAVVEFGDDAMLVMRLAEFIEGLECVDRVVVDTEIDSDPAKILALPEWLSLRDRSRQLRVYAELHGYRAPSRDSMIGLQN